MITILCVLRSGGIYDEQWVRKLMNGVARHLPEKHRFACLSDVEVPCERIELSHDWPGWWSKVEVFRPGVVNGPTLYFDLDTVITGDLSPVVRKCEEYYFAILENFNDRSTVNSSVMWFADTAPTEVYDRFAQAPDRIMQHYQNVKVGSYMGDQAFIWDTMDRQIDTISMKAIRSYKRHCRNGLPEDTSVVCFHGRPRPTEVNPAWLEANWS